MYYAYTSRQSVQIEKGELNMGDPQTLADFINWAKTTYPAEHYALIIVDHGTGISGVAEDKQFRMAS